MEEQINIGSTNQPVGNVDAYKAILEMEQQKQNLKAKESFLKSYIWSVLLPPIGIYFFIKYFFFADGSPSSRKAAVINLVLTIVSLILNIWGIQVLLNQVVSSNGQDLNSLKELTNPENQKSLQQLLQ